MSASQFGDLIDDSSAGCGNTRVGGPEGAAGKTTDSKASSADDSMHAAGFANRLLQRWRTAGGSEADATERHPRPQQPHAELTRSVQHRAAPILHPPVRRPVVLVPQKVLIRDGGASDGWAKPGGAGWSVVSGPPRDVCGAWKPMVTAQPWSATAAGDASARQASRSRAARAEKARANEARAEAARAVDATTRAVIRSATASTVRNVSPHSMVRSCSAPSVSFGRGAAAVIPQWRTPPRRRAPIRLVRT